MKGKGKSEILDKITNVICMRKYHREFSILNKYKPFCLSAVLCWTSLPAKKRQKWKELGCSKGHSKDNKFCRNKDIISDVKL